MGNYQSMLTVREVADLLGVKDTETALRWLRQRSIPVHQVGRAKVFAVHVHIGLDVLLAKDLMTRYPAAWENIYRTMAYDETVYRLVVAELRKEVPFDTPPTQIRPQTDEEKELLKRLTKK